MPSIGQKPGSAFWAHLLRLLRLPLLALLLCGATVSSGWAQTEPVRVARGTQGDGSDQGARPTRTFAAVIPGQPMHFPIDRGAHPEYRTEWWYATGWLQRPDGKPLGFQITFFRSATDHDHADPSAFAPTQLIIAHAAISDPDLGHLVHDQQIARQNFDLAYAKRADTDVKLNDWRMRRDADGSYRVNVQGATLSLHLTMTPTQAPLLQGKGGFSQKGPRPDEASEYYSEPQLRVTGHISRAGDSAHAPLTALAVTGSAWLDHEWSSTVLDPQAVGWDWLGANMSDGSALMAFTIRGKHGNAIWAHATWRDVDGQVRDFGANAVTFAPLRHWRSPRTDASYPVEQTLTTGDMTWRLSPLFNDQELDSSQSTGSVYWEGAVQLVPDRHQSGPPSGPSAGPQTQPPAAHQASQPNGRGYLELTGYGKPLRLK